MKWLEFHPSMREPDPAFLREMEEVFKYDDREFAVWWDNKNERWAIFVREGERTKRVLTVRNEDGSYRPLDSRTIVKLRKMFFKTPEPVDSFEEAEEHNRRLSEQNDRDLSNKAEDFFKEHDRIVRGVPLYHVGAPDKMKEETK